MDHTKLRRCTSVDEGRDGWGEKFPLGDGGALVLHGKLRVSLDKDWAGP